MAIGVCSADVTFFHLLFNGPLVNQLSRNVLGRFLQDMYIWVGVGMLNRPSFRDRSRDVAMVIDFCRESANITIRYDTVD